jgi:2-amino-4-hydroxy-6-hydroxymethyldihydropteridine diphosphokinase
MQKRKIYVLLGGNSGEATRRAFANVIQFIEATFGEVLRLSSVYKSPAWGYASANPYYNQVVYFKSDKLASTILELLLKEEQHNGRERRSDHEGYADRIIDVDILYLDREVIATAQLEVPHPRLHLRRFTLLPLVEVAPEFVHPVFKKTNKELLERCGDDALVLKL